jgi:hypothetical protein
MVLALAWRKGLRGMLSDREVTKTAKADAKQDRSFFRPYGAGRLADCGPRAGARGYSLSPLRGWAAGCSRNQIGIPPRHAEDAQLPTFIDGRGHRLRRALGSHSCVALYSRRHRQWQPKESVPSSVNPSLAQRPVNRTFLSGRTTGHFYLALTHPLPVRRSGHRPPLPRTLRLGSGTHAPTSKKLFRHFACLLPFYQT